MDTKKLTAEYICKDQERLQMALQVYQAMPLVRDTLIERVLCAVGKRVAEKYGGVELETYHNSVFFAPQGTSELWVYAWAEKGKRGLIQLSAGVYAESTGAYAESVSEVQREEMKGRFETDAGMRTWAPKGDVQSAGRFIAYADIPGGHWHDDDFLERAILKQDGVVSEVVDVLAQIYKGMFPSQ